MALHHTNRLRASLRQRRRRTRSLQAASCRVQFCAVTLAALLALTGATVMGTQASSSVEYQVKAAFLLNFAKFIEWPSTVFQSEKTPIAVCVFGYDPFGSALDEIIRRQNVNSRELLARRINELTELKTCQLVFVGEREEKHLPEILNSVKETSALLVGEGEDFAERGGCVQFFIENKRMRFAVNVDAVQRARLTVSSKLLALARIVHDKDHPKGA